MCRIFLYQKFELLQKVEADVSPESLWKTLRINLISGERIIEELPDEQLRIFLGGRAFGAYHLLKEVPAGADPLGPDNKLIIATGVLTQSKLSGANRFSVLAKSPLTGGYGESEAGGWFGPELVATGYNAVILEGQAERPVYLWIHDGQAEIRDAGEIWGLANKPAYEWLQQQHGRVRILGIGPAGENQVLYANLINELHHANGRGGLGAVMGSKRVKAIVVSGSLALKAVEPEVLDGLRKWHNQYLIHSSFGKYFRESGTASALEYQNLSGGLPTFNFNEMIFEGAYKIGLKALVAGYLKGHSTCYSCVLRCKPVSYDPDDASVDPLLGGPEYETLAALGSLLGISNIKTLVKANALANNYGMDVISLGGSIAFAIECYQAGLLTTADTGGLHLTWGDSDLLLDLIECITYRSGIGNLLAEGSRRMARQIGGGAEEFAMQVKGQELPMHDPRTKISQALAYSVCPTGADHMTSSFDDTFAKHGPAMTGSAPLGILTPISDISLGPEKVRLYTYLHFERSLHNSLLICNFVAQPMTPLNLPKLTQAVRAVTGWDISDWEMLKTGERGITLARLFNLLHGFTSADDELPKRMFVEIKSGPKAGRAVDPQVLKEAQQLYYGMMGWDASGVPTIAKLAELGLSNFTT